MHVCGGWGVDGGWMPLSTCPQRYCNPVLNVLNEALSICWSVGHARVVTFDSKTRKTLLLVLCMCECVGERLGGGLGWGWSEAPVQPSATIL